MQLNRNLVYLYKASVKNRCSFVRLVFLHIFDYFRGKNINKFPGTRIYGIKNIITNGILNIGLNYVGFIDKKDATILNIRGKMLIHGNVSIGRGCRLDICPKGSVEIGNNTCFTAMTKLIISNKLLIGENCMISWDCQILDNDFHEIIYENKKNNINNNIVIGNHVWIGSRVSIYKGATIPDDCVIASNSVVKTNFTQKNVLIGGNPARVIKENVNWK
jgi:acetyltransferase-like isoleucine patch superfamily enzyme